MVRSGSRKNGKDRTVAIVDPGSHVVHPIATSSSRRSGRALGLAFAALLLGIGGIGAWTVGSAGAHMGIYASVAGVAETNGVAAAFEPGTINTDESLLATALTGVPTCAPGQAPWIHFAVHANKESGGAPTIDAALKTTSPAVGAYVSYPWTRIALQKGPVWIVAGGETFIATTLRDGSWFVSPATFNGCRTIPAQYMRSR